MAQENNEDRKKIRLQKTSTARLKVVNPNRPVVDGTNPDETVVSESEENAVDATSAATGSDSPPAEGKAAAAATSSEQAAATSAETEPETIVPEGDTASAAGSTVRPAKPPANKTNTVQLQVVQQKKKELDDRIRAHNTVKLKAPIKPQEETDSTPNTNTKSFGSVDNTVKMSAVPSSAAAAAETVSNAPTEATKAEAAETGAKKTLKIKRPGSDRTVKMPSAAKSEATTRMPTPAQTSERAGVQGLAGVEAGQSEAKDQPGILYTLGSVVTLAACAALLFFLVTQYLTHFSF